LGWEVRLAAPTGGPLPYSAELLFAAPRLALAAFGAYDLAVAIKPYPDAWLGLLSARLRGALCVVDVDDRDGAYRGGLAAGLTRGLQAPAYAVADLASTHHPLLKADLVGRLGPERVVDLAQGVDLEIFDAVRLKAGRAAWRRGHGLQRSSVLAFTAHLNVACRMELLLESLGPWLRRHPRAALVVAGSGPLEARFRRLAAPLGAQVRFLGAVSPAQAAETLAGSDCLVAAYGASEGDAYRVPMKVAEGLAMGLPVVTHGLPGLRRLQPFVFEAQHGPQAYGAALDRALGPKQPRVRRGQAWVRRELDWTRVACRFLAQVRAFKPLPRGSAER
jgi:alpha-1,6-mannosyltransferase